MGWIVTAWVMSDGTGKKCVLWIDGDIGALRGGAQLL